jgi:hypothetical protein
MVRRSAVCLIVLAVGAALGGSSADGVVGGQKISVRSAPWAVFIRDSFGPSESYICSGTIIDASHVLTAAHCVFSVSGVFTRPSRLKVEAGISDYRRPRATDARQDRAVRSIRVYPGYVSRDPPTLSDTAHDLAVLTLSQPLDLSGPNARAAALAPARTPAPYGAEAMVAGFGRNTPSRATDGPLILLRLRVATRSNCAGSGVLCASSASGGTCEGDSGAGLIATPATPRLVAVLSEGGATTKCLKNVLAVYVNLGTASARAFIYGHGRTGTPSPAPAERWVPSGWKGYALKLVGKGGLAFSLPRSWSATFSPFVASNRQTGTTVRAAMARGTWSKARYFARSLDNALASYRKTDPAAVVHSRELSLPGAQVLEVSVRLTAPQGARRILTSVRDYFFLDDHRGYDLQCFWPASHDGINIPLFNQFVRTIHFLD